MLIAFSVSFIIGYLVVCLIMEKDDVSHQRNDICLHMFLSLPLGLGISSLLIFYSLIFFHRFNMRAFLFVHFVLLFVLLIATLKTKKLGRDIRILNITQINHIGWLVVIAFLLLLVLWQALPYFIMYPYGLWDAITVWNLRARFILTSDNWLKAFSPLMIHTDYPFLLPVILVWGWGISNQITPLWPILISFFYGSSVILFILFSISRYHGLKRSLLMALFFINIPGFFNLITSQYADIVLSCYNFIGIVLCFFGAKENRKDYIMLGEIALGFSLLTKNEGLLFFFCLNAVIFLYLLIKNRLLLKAFRHSIAVSFVFLLTLITFKLHVPQSTKAFSIKSISLLLVYNKIMEFLSSLYEYFLRSHSKVFLLLFVGIFILFYKELFKKERVIMSLTFILVLMGYSIVLLLTENSIMDHLWFTWPRLIFHLLPLLCFVVADIIFGNNTIKAGE